MVLLFRFFTDERLVFGGFDGVPVIEQRCGIDFRVTQADARYVSPGSLQRTINTFLEEFVRDGAIQLQHLCDQRNDHVVPAKQFTAFGAFTPPAAGTTPADSVRLGVWLRRYAISFPVARSADPQCTAPLSLAPKSRLWRPMLPGSIHFRQTAIYPTGAARHLETRHVSPYPSAGDRTWSYDHVLHVNHRSENFPHEFSRVFFTDGVLGGDFDRVVFDGRRRT